MRYLRIIADQARRLESHLLNLRTVAEGGLELQLEELDLREMLADQVAGFEGQLTEHELDSSFRASRSCSAPTGAASARSSAT